MADEKLHTFVALPSDKPPGLPADVWRLRQPSSEQREVPPAQQASVLLDGPCLRAVFPCCDEGCRVRASLGRALLASQQPLAWPPAPPRAPLPAQAASGVNVVVKAGQGSVLLQDAFHVPLLEVNLGSGARLLPVFGWCWALRAVYSSLLACLFTSALPAHAPLPAVPQWRRACGAPPSRWSRLTWGSSWACGASTAPSSTGSRWWSPGT